MARNLVQSITVEADEKLLLDTLAKHKRVRPAALARLLLFRGLSDFLGDDKIYPAEHEPEISESLKKKIESDKEMRKVREMIKKQNSTQRSTKQRRRQPKS